MRGAFVDQGGLFSYISPEARVPPDHPLRKIRELIREVLAELNRSLGKLYASEGRPSIPPEQLLSALLLQVLYGIRSERQLIEQLNYNFLYRWFVGLSPDDRVWVPTTFTKNRERLQNGEMFTKFMTKLLNHLRTRGCYAVCCLNLGSSNRAAGVSGDGVPPVRASIDERTTRHEGYGMSQSRRAMIECIFGWGKQHGRRAWTRKTSAPTVLTAYRYLGMQTSKLQ